MYLFAMRAILVTCIFYILLNIVIGDDESFKISPHIIQSYPKHVKKYKGLEVKFMNRRYMKNNSTVAPIRTKKHTENSYTVFPMRDDKSAVNLNIPDSPYFPFDKYVDDKASVKMELIRKRRSADEKSDGDIQVKITDRATVSQSTAAPQESSTTTPQQSSTTTPQQSSTTTPQQSSTTTPQQSSTTKPLGLSATKPLVKESAVVKANTVASVKEAKVPKAGENPTRRFKVKRRIPRPRSKIQKPQRNGGGVKTVKKGAKQQAKRTGNHKSKPVVQHKFLKAPKAKKLVAGRRLIAGRDALVEEYPYVVSIQKDEEHWCSGALLNQRLVITTANCVWKASRMSRLRVRAGTRFSDRGGQLAKIQEVMKHPGWSIRDKPDYDVALMLIDRNIRFSHNVHAVDLPNRVMMPPFEDAWVTSWGAERRDGVYEKKGLSLQAYHVRLMNKEKCNNVTKRYGVLVTENFICLSQAGRRAPCTRDTGAPAVSDGILWGLASWGIRKLCGTERFPAMFSYIASHSNMDFIANATRFLMADERHYPFGDRYVYTIPSTIKSRGPAEVIP